MSERFENFGFYRIMHAKSAEVTQCLERDLPPQVKAAFAQYQPANKAAIEKELAKAVEGSFSSVMACRSAWKSASEQPRLGLEGVWSIAGTPSRNLFPPVVSSSQPCTALVSLCFFQR